MRTQAAFVSAPAVGFALLVACLTTAASAWAARKSAAAPVVTAPVAIIVSPLDGAEYAPGAALPLVGSVSDSAAGASFRWAVSARHADRTKSEARWIAGRTATFTPDTGEAGYEISLVVANAKGVSDTTTVHVVPRGAQTTGPDPAASPERSYPLGSGDQVHIAIYAGGEKQEDFTADVSAQGMLTSPLLGDIRVGGYTAAEVSEHLRAVLARDFFVDPQVLVNVTSYARKVFVSGEVRNPGAYSLQEGLTVMGACTLAGGFTDFAAPNRAKVFRTQGGNTKTIEIDLAKVRKGKIADPVVVAGDRIDVPHRRY